MKKKLLAMALVTAMSLSLVACGGGSDSGSGSDSEGGSASGEAAASTGVSITVFNTKSEIQDQFVEMAEEYSAATGVDVEVYYSSDTVAAHLATRYSANDPYTISMVDAKDVYSLGEEHAIDLSDQEWVANTDYAISVGGKVLGFPVCIEARGLMYNATAIEAITGEEFNPDDYKTLDAFLGLLDQLVAGGMETPTGIMKEDWSMGAHYLAEVYEEQPDVEAFITSLHEGSADLANNEKWNSLMDTFDVLMKYNYAAGSPVAAEREVSEQKLAEGEIAFMFGGNWDWAMINAYDYSEKMGMMPVPQNTSDGSNEKLVGGGSKYFMIDSSDNTSAEQQQAAKDFLNWLVFDEAGNKFLTEDCALVPAYSNINADALDPLSISVKAFADGGNLIENYNYLPDDHYSINGASFQKYLAGQVDRAGLAAEIESYWSSTTPVEH
ncbi:ABC transporter substrate-binding protein [Parablautia muri]|uniref:Carbohydrate ABC transporter substrate-binding protein n=1 Tax=Parablautia muri TaxID=2320879 RepID=A0A9X5GT39_9FIRM|nr:ABC transporter substrate-binding protein [Parablautia muri]NBJ93596.1 carbohydrate ABC transporter substrate-binding protein [Parablautia muri]